MPTLVVRCPEDEGRPEVPSMTLRSHLRGVEVLPALAQDSLSQAEISLYSVTENLADRPTRPDKSGQEMHTNPTGFPLASSDPPRVCNGAVGVSATPPPQGYTAYTASTSVFTISIIECCFHKAVQVS